MTPLTLPNLPNATSQRAKRHELDCYLTPRPACEALFDRFPEIGGDSCIEACSGGGVLSDVIGRRFRNVITNDVCPKIGADYCFDARTPSLYEAIRVEACRQLRPAAKWLITNPPYSVWGDIAHRALTEDLYVALLLRISALEATMRRRWLVEMSPSHLLILPRIKFKGPSGTDSCCHTWVIWSSAVPRGISYATERSRQASLFLPPSISSQHTEEPDGR